MSGFRFARLAIFAIAENPDKQSADKRPPAEDARAVKNPENPLIPILAKPARAGAVSPAINMPSQAPLRR